MLSASKCSNSKTARSSTAFAGGPKPSAEGFWKKNNGKTRHSQGKVVRTLVRTHLISHRYHLHKESVKPQSQSLTPPGKLVVSKEFRANWTVPKICHHDNWKRIFLSTLSSLVSMLVHVVYFKGWSEGQDRDREQPWWINFCKYAPPAATALLLHKHSLQYWM